MISAIRELFLPHLPIEVRCQLSHWKNYKAYKKIWNAADSKNPISFFSKNQCVFIHIPKTGGQSIKKALFDTVEGGHKSAGEIMRIIGPVKFYRYYSFTFVRNPFERLVSAYTYLKKGGMNKKDKAFSKKYLSEYNNFHDFVMEWVNHENIQLYDHFIPQHKFIFSKNGKCLVDKVGRFETLQKDFEEICERLEINASLPHCNKTHRKRSYEDYYNPNLKQKVAAVYKRDFDLLGYDPT